MTTPVTEALTVTQADRMLVEVIINDYHTTRLDSDYVSHILSKPRTQAAFARYRIAHTAPTEPVLRWEGNGLYLGEWWVGRAWEGTLCYWFECGLTDNCGTTPTLTEARTAAEQAVRDWLARAGLVRQGGEPVAWQYKRKDFAPAISIRQQTYPDLQWQRPLYTHPPASPTAEVVEAANDGPQLVVLPPRLTCTGCRHLETERWEDYLDNDETDSGTSAHCTAVANEHGVKWIASYWTNNSPPPEWCPRAALAKVQKP